MNSTLAQLSSAVVGWTVGLAYDCLTGAFPRTVRIETTNACNAKCVICPHPVMERTVQRMDEQLYRAIIDECAAQHCPQVHLHNFGEPLLDVQLCDRIRYAKSKGIRKVKIFSNGALANERIATALLDAGLDEIKVSFDGATKEEFERIRAPLKYDLVMANLRRLVQLRDARRSPLRITVNCCSTTDKDQSMAALATVVDEFSFSRLHNWADGDYAQAQTKIRKPCSRLWRTFTVLVNGDVALCCLDYDGKTLMGRVTATTSIRQIWRATEYRQVRGWHRRSQQARIELCRTCSKSFV